MASRTDTRGSRGEGAARGAAAEVVRLRVLFFSVLRERIGALSTWVELPAPADGADLLAHLCAVYPAVAPYRAHIRLAVNEVYQPSEVALADGDEVALITPVSGG